MIKPQKEFYVITNPDQLVRKELKQDNGIVIMADSSIIKDKIIKCRIAKIVRHNDNVHDLKDGDYIMIEPYKGLEIIKDVDNDVSVMLIRSDEIMLKLEDYHDDNIEDQYNKIIKNNY